MALRYDPILRRFVTVFGVAGGGIVGNTKGTTINTGALVANTPKSIVHALNLDNYQLEVHDNSNNVEVSTLKKDPADVKNKVIVEVGVNLPGGLDAPIIGYN